MKDIKNPLKDKNKHWQEERYLCAPGAPNPKDCFNPMKPTQRPSTHVKTNECDY